MCVEVMKHFKACIVYNCRQLLDKNWVTKFARVI